MAQEPKGNAKEWQRSPWVQILAIIIGVVPAYLLPILSSIRNDQRLSFKDIFLYTTVQGTIMIIVMLLLLKFLCGERIRDLNLKPGKWWGDILMGIGLSILTLVVFILLQNPLNAAFPREVDSALGTFLDELVRNPVLFGLVMGPVLIIGAGIFEELSRVFLLTRLWNINSTLAFRWFAVVLSAVIFGLGHLYQGPAGIISTGISGLIMAVYYSFSGRVIPMMIAHYLHDAIQIAAVYMMANVS
jgi:membrane protease YdiL (CAAX protease family)